MPPVAPPTKPMKNSSFACRHSHRGFSLMELLVVIAIIVILASLVLGGLGFMERNKNTQKCKAQMGMLSTALEEYKMDFGRYPVANDSGVPADTGSNVLYKALYWDSNDDGSGVGSDSAQRIYLAELDPLNNKQGWRSATTATAANTILDPWGEEFRYRSGVDAAGVVNNDCKNPDFDLWSFGPDGKVGNADGTDEDAQDNESNWK